jgi:hypothetical protein
MHVQHAVLDRVVAEAAAEAGRAAAQHDDPVESLRAGCGAWLRLSLDPAVQQVALVDAPAVLGWEEWREIDARYGLGLVSFALRNAMDRGVFRDQEVTPLAHLLIGAMTEAAMMVANASDPEAARREAEPALLALVEGLRR